MYRYLLRELNGRFDGKRGEQDEWTRSAAERSADSQYDRAAVWQDVPPVLQGDQGVVVSPSTSRRCAPGSTGPTSWWHNWELLTSW